MSSKPKTFRCLNENCEYAKRKRHGNPLFKGHIEGKSFVIVRCRFCGVDRGVNVTEEKPVVEEKKLAPKLDDVAKLLVKKN